MIHVRIAYVDGSEESFELAPEEWSDLMDFIKEPKEFFRIRPGTYVTFSQIRKIQRMGW